jgi:hypothetical protein
MIIRIKLLIKDLLWEFVRLKRPTLKIFFNKLKKITTIEDFKVIFTKRLQNDKIDKKSQKKIDDFVDSILQVIEHINTTFGQDMATKSIEQLLQMTKSIINAKTIATGITGALKKEQSDIYDIYNNPNCTGNNDNYKKVIETQINNLEKMVDFLN